MKDNCQMVKDLLPLYAENVASEESRNFVSAHLEECETCRNQLKELQAALPEESRKMSEEEEALFQKKVRELLRRRRRRVLRNVLFGIAIGLVLFLFFSFANQDCMTTFLPKIWKRRIISFRWSD